MSERQLTARLGLPAMATNVNQHVVVLHTVLASQMQSFRRGFEINLAEALLTSRILQGHSAAVDHSNQGGGISGLRSCQSQEACGQERAQALLLPRSQGLWKCPQQPGIRRP